jgi:hypothetical protein
MTMQEIADMYNVFGCYVRKAVKAIFKDGILKEQGVRRHVRKNDRISYDVYNLEMIIAIAFRICSKESILFRRFVINEICATKKVSLITLFFSCGEGSNLWVTVHLSPKKHPILQSLTTLSRQSVVP